MFGVTGGAEEKILKLPCRNREANLLLSCIREQNQNDLQNCCKTKKPVQERISIKKLLRRNHPNSQSCTLLSELNGVQINGGKNQSRYLSTIQAQSHAKCFSNLDNNRPLVRANTINEGLSSQARQIRIFYQNKPFAKSQQFGRSKLTHYGETQEKSFKNEAASMDNLECAISINQSNESQFSGSRKVAFNQFVSFGPKNMGIFKNISTLQINRVESDVIEETERTEMESQQNPLEQKRLTKTCSHLQLERDLQIFSTSALHPEKLRQGLKGSEFFKSLKHAETMKDDFNSDHESQVIQNFQSLIQKVKENRLQNWSFASDFAEI